ncbi:putative LigA [Burkholderia gladioli]|nr:putative LigA [Burkholderia gladioli]
MDEAAERSADGLVRPRRQRDARGARPVHRELDLVPRPGPAAAREQPVRARAVDGLRHARPRARRPGAGGCAAGRVCRAGRCPRRGRGRPRHPARTRCADGALHPAGLGDLARSARHARARLVRAGARGAARRRAARAELHAVRRHRRDHARRDAGRPPQILATPRARLPVRISHPHDPTRHPPGLPRRRRGARPPRPAPRSRAPVRRARRHLPRGHRDRPGAARAARQPEGLRGCGGAAGRRAGGAQAHAGGGRLRLRRRHRLRGGGARPAHARRLDRLPGAEPLRIRLRPHARDRQAGRRAPAGTVDHGRQRHRQRRRRGRRQRARHRRAGHRPPPARRDAARGARHRQPEPARLRIPEQAHRRGRRDVLCAAGAARRAAPPRRLRRCPARAAPGRPARPGRTRHGGRRGAPGRQQPRAGRAGPAAHPEGSHAARHRRAVPRRRARGPLGLGLRSRLRPGPAPERGGPPVRHVARHRMPDHRRHRPRLGAGPAARHHESRAPRDRGRHAAAGAGRPGPGRSGRGGHHHAVQSRLAPGRDRYRRGPAQGEVPPPLVHLRACRRERRARQGLGALDPGLSSARRAGPGLQARAGPAGDLRRPRDGRRRHARDRQGAALRRRLRGGGARMAVRGGALARAGDRRRSRGCLFHAAVRRTARWRGLGPGFPCAAVLGRVRGGLAGAGQGQAPEAAARARPPALRRDLVQPHRAAAGARHRRLPPRQRHLERRDARAIDRRARCLIQQRGARGSATRGRGPAAVDRAAPCSSNAIRHRFPGAFPRFPADFPANTGGSRARGPGAPTGRAPRSAIISPFHEAGKAIITMEAERLNAIESSLADLRRRAGELRGYL